MYAMTAPSPVPIRQQHYSTTPATDAANIHERTSHLGCAYDEVSIT